MSKIINGKLISDELVEEYEKTLSINQPILDKLGFDIDPKSTDFTYNFWLTLQNMSFSFFSI